MLEFVQKDFQKQTGKKNVLIISAGAFIGIEEFKDYLIDHYAIEPTTVQEADTMIDATRIYDLKNQKSANDFKLKYKGNAEFEVTGERIEQIVRMTNMSNHESIMRVYDIMEKLHIVQAVENRIATEYGEKITESYFEGNDTEISDPVIWIAGRKFELEKTRFLKKERR